MRIYIYISIEQLELRIYVQLCASYKCTRVRSHERKNIKNITAETAKIH